MRTPKILVLERDPALADQVRQTTAKLRPRPEVVACEKLGSTGETFREAGAIDVLVAGPTLASQSGLSRLRHLHAEHSTMSVVLAFANRPNANLREIVRTGAVDLLQLPADDDTMLDILSWALEVSRQRREAVAPPSNGSSPPVTEAAGSVLTVASPTGGCGKTFFATNLAYLLHQRTGKRTCLVDLDLEFGQVATALRMKPRYTVFDLLQREGASEEELNQFVDEYVIAHESGFHVLAAPKDPAAADGVEVVGVTRLLEALRSQFSYVVVDTAVSLTETLLAAVDLSDQVCLLANFDVLSVRSTRVFLDLLENLKLSPDAVRVFLNKVERDVGIDLEQVGKLFPKGFAAVIPYAREVTRSLSLGVPMLAYQPGSDVSAALTDGMRTLLPPEENGAAMSAGAGLVTRVLRRARTIDVVHAR